MGDISWMPKVKWESHPRLEVSVAVNIVKSRQVSEVRKKKFSKAPLVCLASDCDAIRLLLGVIQLGLSTRPPRDTRLQTSVMRPFPEYRRANSYPWCPSLPRRAHLGPGPHNDLSRLECPLLYWRPRHPSGGLTQTHPLTQRGILPLRTSMDRLGQDKPAFGWELEPL